MARMSLATSACMTMSEGAWSKSLQKILVRGLQTIPERSLKQVVGHCRIYVRVSEMVCVVFEMWSCEKMFIDVWFCHVSVLSYFDFGSSHFFVQSASRIPTARLGSFVKADPRAQITCWQANHTSRCSIADRFTLRLMRYLTPNSHVGANGLTANQSCLGCWRGISQLAVPDNIILHTWPL